MRKEIELELKRAVERYREVLLELSKEEIFEMAYNEYNHWEDIVELIEVGIYTEEEVYIKTIPLLIENKVRSMI